METNGVETYESVDIRKCVGSNQDMTESMKGSDSTPYYKKRIGPSSCVRQVNNFEGRAIYPLN